MLMLSYIQPVNTERRTSCRQLMMLWMIYRPGTLVLALPHTLLALQLVRLHAGSLLAIQLC